MPTVLEERITLTTVEDLCAWASFDFHLSQTCMAEVESLAQKCFNLVLVARKEHPDKNSWGKRNAFAKESLEEAQIASKSMEPIYQRVSLEGNVKSIRESIGKIRFLSQIICESLNELRLTEDELSTAMAAFL